jgi:hypothetical protein
VDILEDFKAVSNRATSTENMVLQWKKLFAASSTKKNAQDNPKHEKDNTKM